MFHDNKNLECDCVLVLDDGRYALIEIKLYSPKRIEEGINNLNKLEKIIKQYNTSLKEDGKSISKKIPMPSFKMILTNFEFSMIKDGVYIVPLAV